MHWPTLTDKAEVRLRIFLLALAVLASVVLPYALLRDTAQQTRDDAAWVTHSAEVKQTTSELMYMLRDMETIVLAMYADAPMVDGPSKYQADRTRIEKLVERLAASTRDNPDQQNLIGTLRGIVDGRSRMFDKAMQDIGAKNYDGAREAIAQGRTLFPLRDTGEEILALENTLFANRSSVAADSQRTADWAMFGSFAAQLVLLAAVIFLSERQVQRRLNAESEAEQAIARSRAIVQNVREPIILLDPSLHLLLTNAAFREVYGEKDIEAVGVALESLGGGAWKDAVLLQRLADVGARDRELWDYELTQRRTDGVERDVLINARRMVLPATDEPAILLTVNDITARKRSQQKIHELNRELQAKVAQVSEVNRELESFSYSVSHDLRAPLRHISGFADKLGVHLGEGADEKAHHYLEVISSSAQRMSALIEDLLLYSQLGRNALRLQPVDMHAIVEEIRAMLVSEAGERNIQWRLGNLPVVIADDSMMRQVWQNLISNAVKYTARRAKAVIEIGVDCSNPAEMIFFIKDNGTGFDMEYATKLFGVFQRLHKAADFPGTGIGLANVRRIATRHGGRSWAEAVADKGATFYFSLPASIAAVQSPEVPE